MSFGGGGGGDGTTTVLYAPYITWNHNLLMEQVRGYAISYAVADQSPYYGYTDLDVDPGFFGTGYVLSSFPALYDMFGKFMAGLDIEALFTQIFDDTVNSSVVDDMVSAEGTRLSDDIEQTAQPRMTTGMRDINAVMSSTFVIAKALLEDARTKALAAYDAKLRYALVQTALDRWKSHLDWNKGVVTVYSEILKMYLVMQVDADKHNYEMKAKHKLWPFTCLEYFRLSVGVMSGATTTTTDVAGASQGAKAFGGALMGAGVGGMVTGSPMGAIVGGVLGLAAGLLS